MAANTAFEAITKRLAYYTNAAIAKYHGVQWAADGTLELADGTKPFAGIVEYGTDAANEMATVVMGIFPGIAKEANLAKGTYVTFEDGLLVKATSGTAALGITLSAGSKANDLVGVSLFDAPYTVS